MIDRLWTELPSHIQRQLLHAAGIASGKNVLSLAALRELYSDAAVEARLRRALQDCSPLAPEPLPRSAEEEIAPVSYGPQTAVLDVVGIGASLGASIADALETPSPTCGDVARHVAAHGQLDVRGLGRAKLAALTEAGRTTPLLPADPTPEPTPESALPNDALDDEKRLLLARISELLEVAPSPKPEALAKLQLLVGAARDALELVAEAVEELA